MAKILQLALWNANGLTQHIEELKTFISIHNILRLDSPGGGNPLQLAGAGQWRP
jgi:hypothetical protein